MNITTVAQQAQTASFFMPARGVLQRKCACGSHTVAGGECAACAKNKAGLERKLAIGASNDPLEREADRVADQPGRVHSMHQTTVNMMNDKIVTNIIKNNRLGAWNAPYF